LSYCLCVFHLASCSTEGVGGVEGGWGGGGGGVWVATSDIRNTY